MQRLDRITIVALSLFGVFGLVLTGFGESFAIELDRSFFFLNLATTVTLAWWIFADAARNKIPLGVGTVLAALLCFPAFFVFYSFRSRGAKGWLLCAGGIGALAVYVLLALLITLLFPAFS